MTTKKEKKQKEEQKGIYAKGKDMDKIVDSMVKNRLSSLIERGGNVRSWPEDELVIRRQAILEMIRKGLSRSRMTEEMMARWGIGLTTAKAWINDAMNALGETNKEFMDHIREVQSERLEKLLEESVRSGDKKAALAALDQLNKIGGLYSQKVDLNASGEMRFDFGTTDEA